MLPGDLPLEDDLNHIMAEVTSEICRDLHIPEAAAVKSIAFASSSNDTRPPAPVQRNQPPAKKRKGCGRADADEHVFDDLRNLCQSLQIPTPAKNSPRTARTGKWRYLERKPWLNPGSMQRSIEKISKNKQK